MNNSLSCVLGQQVYFFEILVNSTRDKFLNIFHKRVVFYLKIAEQTQVLDCNLKVV